MKPGDLREVRSLPIRCPPVKSIALKFLVINGFVVLLEELEKPSFWRWKVLTSRGVVWMTATDVERDTVPAFGDRT